MKGFFFDLYCGFKSIDVEAQVLNIKELWVLGVDLCDEYITAGIVVIGGIDEKKYIN